MKTLDPLMATRLGKGTCSDITCLVAAGMLLQALRTKHDDTVYDRLSYMDFSDNR